MQQSSSCEKAKYARSDFWFLNHRVDISIHPPEVSGVGAALSADEVERACVVVAAAGPLVQDAGGGGGAAVRGARADVGRAAEAEAL